MLRVPNSTVLAELSLQLQTQTEYLILRLLNVFHAQLN